MALNIYEQKLARIIAKSRIKLTTTQLAKKAGIPWQKAKNNLESLRRNAPVSRQTLGNRIYWFVRKK